MLAGAGMDLGGGGRRGDVKEEKKKERHSQLSEGNESVLS